MLVIKRLSFRDTVEVILKSGLELLGVGVEIEA